MYTVQRINIPSSEYIFYTTINFIIYYKSNIINKQRKKLMMIIIINYNYNNNFFLFYEIKTCIKIYSILIVFQDDSLKMNK